MSLVRLAKRLRKLREKGSGFDGSGRSVTNTLTRDGSLAPSDLPQRPPALDGGRSKDSTATTVPESIPQTHSIPPFASADAVTSAMNGALADLVPMSTRLESGPHVGKSEQKLNGIGTQFREPPSRRPAHLAALPGNTINDATAKVSPVVAFLKDVTSTDLAQRIEHGIQRFTENMPWLMKSLDELARIHPVVTGMPYQAASDLVE